MSKTVGLFTVSQSTHRRLQRGDGVVLLRVVVALGALIGVIVALDQPAWRSDPSVPRQQWPVH